MNSQKSFFPERPEQASPLKHRWNRALEMVEVGPAGLCSLILWNHARELEDPSATGRVNSSRAAGLVPSDFILHPAPKLVLISALGFGCCVSSFVYRRQKEDQFQVVVFALLVGTVATVEYGVGGSSNMILLGYMPFATCAAMVISACCHAILRDRRFQKGSEAESLEKVRLLWSGAGAEKIGRVVS
ncbi:hypothetical protein GE09DRAFT_171121 [Coniochaeta sp. 2T2.1]|nr:hypothetical protein GE09DRAFT_171121 [Coniochaeta sp. 2T2.1]